MMKYDDFRVIVEDRNRIRVVSSNQQSWRGTIQMDQLREKILNDYCDMLSEGAIAKRQYLVTFGTLLYEVLFDTATSRAFKSQFDKIRNQPSSSITLRLILEFESEARELAEMPWEYLYYPDNKDGTGKGFFLATHRRLILARYVPLNQEMWDNLKPNPRPLRILLVISEPEDLGPVKADPVMQVLKELENSSPMLIKIDVLKQPTKRSLSERVEQFRPQVLHFIGHGQYDSKEGGSLALIDENDQSEHIWMSDTDVADCFIDYQPHLIFLHVCDGARSDSYRAFRGLALQLVHSHVPAVVAMQYQVENKVANLFAKTFYEALGKGKPIDASVQAGRLELALYLNEKNFSSRAFGCPVVFLQKSQEIIIPKGQSEREAPLLTHGLISIECPLCSQGLQPDRDLNYCPRCGVPIMKCPNCNQMMPKNGDCKACNYSTEPAKRITLLPPPEPKQNGHNGA